MSVRVLTQKSVHICRYIVTLFAHSSCIDRHFDAACSDTFCLRPIILIRLQLTIVFATVEENGKDEQNYLSEILHAEINLIVTFYCTISS